MRIGPNTPVVRQAIERCANPEMVGNFLTRLVDMHPGLGNEIIEHDVMRDGLIAVACASRSLSQAIITDTSLHDVMREDRAELARSRDLLNYQSSWSDIRSEGTAPANNGELRRTLRRWKRRELLRIAVRDLLGIASMVEVGHELASLAQTCLGAALDLAAPNIPMAVIGMGKLGGSELNYASDVDVLFVHDGDVDGAAAEHAARELLSIMAAPSPDGIVFRIDANLRPEGRSGPLSRNLDSYASYYERWAQTWELQALIKSRPVAGDLGVAARFTALIDPHVWPNSLDPDAVREVRAMKARSEELVRRHGIDDRELKRGRGGIRDIEFAVQLLQLVHGRHDAGIRSPNTLEALDQLAGHEYVNRSDATKLQASYVFLRTVEHRIQLEDETQTHTIPSDPSALTQLARVLGYRDSGSASAVDLFDAEHRRHKLVVRTIHEELFFRPLLEAFAGSGRLSPGAAEERLAAFGFADVAHTRAALAELTHGLTRQNRLMGQLFPLLLEWVSESPDPDLGLLQLRTLAEGPTRSSALTVAFRDTPGAAMRTCKLLGSSRVIGQALRRQPDVVAQLGDDGFLAPEKTRVELVDDALETLAWRPGPAARREGLRRFKRRELLRIAARDVLGFATVEEIGRELSALAEACVEAALQSLAPPVPFAVIGLGRLGGQELSYASDIDVMFVYEGDGVTDFSAAEKTATSLVREISEITPEGRTFRIDCNLRPEGKAGPLARPLDGFRTYYERWADLWELQTLIKARPIAGNAVLGAQFMTLIEPFVFRETFPDESVREVRRMKARIESERIPPGDDPQFHLKLGRGTLSDVEFTVQLLQLMSGGARPDIRATSTIEGLARLAGAGVLDGNDATALLDAYRFCERARNYRYLLTGMPGDSLPGGAEALRLARMLGYAHNPHASLRDDYRRLTRRSRTVVEHAFYGKG